MKLTSVAIGLLACNSVVASPFSKLSELEFGKDFIAWAGKHSKSYDSEAHALERFDVWKVNRDFVLSHNKLAAAGHKTFTVALNKFGDMSNAEYRTKMLGRRSTSASSRAQATYKPSVKAVPDAWDWRTTGIVNAVKNQEQCGSCWAFSAVAAMEGAFNRRANGTVPSTCTSTCVNSITNDGTPCCSFSEQELVDCTNGGKNNCNIGGEMHDGIMEIVTHQDGSINTEAQYPYTSGGGKSPGVCHAQPLTGVKTGITGYANVTQGNETALKFATYEQTIISIGIDASENSFQFYSQGVYNEPNCKNKREQLDHGVAIVGYGTATGPSPGPPSPGPGPGPADCVNNNDEKSCSGETGCHWCPVGGGDFFCFSFPCGQAGSPPLDAAAGTDYWWVRNSWGEEWGMDGYIKMTRGADNQCGVATDAVYALLGNDN